MEIQLNTNTFLRDNITVFEQVFNMRAEWFTLNEGFISPDPDEGIFASLGFIDGGEGRIWLGLRRSEIDMIISRLLQVYDIKVPISEREVFGEMLNIFAANMVTLLKDEGIFLSITPPSLSWPSPFEWEGKHKPVINIATYEGIHFSFYYTFK